MSKIEIETYYPYPTELVWEALTDSEAMSQWLMDNDFKPEAGHKFQFRAKPQKHWKGIVDAKVLEVKKPSRLVYSWKSDEHKTTVVWSLRPEEGGTRLQLAHTGFEGVGGFILSKLILGPGWNKMLFKDVPLILEHIKKSGLKFPKDTWLIPGRERHSSRSHRV